MNQFIPVLIGRPCTHHEREVFTLPTRLGGLNIQNPVILADLEFTRSLLATKELTDSIINQSRVLDDAYQIKRKANIEEMKRQKEEYLKTKYDRLYQQSESNFKRCLDLAGEKGSSIWLNTLPIKSLGYALNKQEFIDSISLRYNFPLKDIAPYCACGERNSIDHALTCMRGGYSIMRHNAVRDLEASLLKEVCRDVQVEPTLIPLSGQQFNTSAIHEDNARLDISVRDFWKPMERAFLDIRMFHPNAPSYVTKPLDKVYQIHENSKKRDYEARIISVEHGTFTPLVFSTSGGFGKDCSRFHKHLASRLAEKRKEQYGDTISYIRRRIRFCILKATLISVRGFRGYKEKNIKTLPLSEIDFSVAEFNSSTRDI